MILSDSAIRALMECGGLKIDGYVPEQLNPASYDVNLYPVIRQRPRAASAGERWIGGNGSSLDLRQVQEEYLVEHHLDERTGYLLEPGEFILGSTQEYIGLGPVVAARVEGKSSLARVGLAVHVTGGFIDPGFSGQVTLEITNLFHRPLVIYPGMRIAQIAFHPVMGEVDRPYGETGRYQNQRGPTLSRYTLDEHHAGAGFYTCSDRGWQGTVTDWHRDVGQERRCYSENCGGKFEMTCPDDHCLECGEST